MHAHRPVRADRGRCGQTIFAPLDWSRLETFGNLLRQANAALFDGVSADMGTAEQIG
jgi:hypothetical protein